MLTLHAEDEKEGGGWLCVYMVLLGRREEEMVGFVCFVLYSPGRGGGEGSRLVVCFYVVFRI